MSYKPQFGDIAHLGHAELLTPDLQQSVRFFRDVIGLHESGRTENSVYLRAWADYERHTLQLTQAAVSGLGHLAFRARSEETLDQLVAYLFSNGVEGNWIEPSFGQGRSFRLHSPDGHLLELYFASERHTIQPGEKRAFKNLPQGYVAHGIAPKRLDHVNLLASNVKACREFFNQLLGLRITEQIIFGEDEMGAWLSATNKSYDIAFTKDAKSARGRFHHLTYAMDSREDVLRAADILVENGVPIETGPHKHSIGQTFFLYFYEPGGNRIEIGSGGYLIFDPEWKPIVWSKEERMKGQAWGLQTVSTFHTYGTPPVD